MDKRIKSILLLILFFVIPYTSLSSITWERTYGGARYDDSDYVCQTSDGGYIIAGSSNSYTPFPYHFAIYVLKINQYGDVDWYKNWGNWGSYGKCIKENDSTYIMLGDNYGPNDIYCMKLNSSGDSLWSRYYGTNEFDEGNRICNTNDGGYAIVGFTRINDRVYLVRIDSVGDTLWTKTYGSGYSEGRAVQQTPDGGFILTGWIYPTGYYDNILLVKTDSTGDTAWTKMYGDTIGSSTINKGYDVDQTYDGGYIVFGSILLKTDSLGDSLWAKEISGVAGQQTSDGGYVIVSTIGTYPYTDICLTKTDSTGNIEWIRTFGGDGEEIAYYTQQTMDGGYVITGITYSYGAGECDVYVIKTDSMGLVGVEEELISEYKDFSVTCIPKGFCIIWIEFNIPQEGNITLKIYDISGRLIASPCNGWFSVGNHHMNINLPNVGVYFYELTGCSWQKTGKLTCF